MTVPPGGDRGFTLVEIMLAVAILAAVSVITMLTFGTVSSAWKRGLTLSDRLHHGDFVIEQLVMALRSAYFPSGGAQNDTYGFWMTDAGADEGEDSSDMISWVKLGSALVGEDEMFAGTPHRVRFEVGEDEDGDRAAMVRAWAIYGQADDFDPEDLPLKSLSKRTIGFNCRMAYEKVDDEWDWLDEWEQTNRLPHVVEVALYLAPLDDGEEAVEIKRVVEIPVSPLSW